MHSYRIDINDSVADTFVLMLNGIRIHQWTIPAPPAGSERTIQTYTGILEIDTKYLRFAQSNGFGKIPTPGNNDLEFTAPDNGRCNDCYTTLTLGPLTFDALAPVVLVYGSTSAPTWFGPNPPDGAGACGTGKGFGFNFVSSFTAAGAPVVCKEVKVKNTAGFEKGARELRDVVSAVERQYGTEHVHIVAHSNGGNWAKTMLSLLTSGDNIGVLSLITLSTPFRGTVLADYATAGAESWRFRFRGIPFFVGSVKGNNDLTHQSQTTFAPAWNASHPVPLTLAVSFAQPDGSSITETSPLLTYSIASNADANHNWQLDTGDSTGEAWYYRLMFKLLALTDSVSTCSSLNPKTGLCAPGQLFSSPVYQTSPALRPNDSVVTTASAQWTQFNPIPGPSEEYWLLNHKYLGNPDVSSVVLETIRHAQPIVF